MDTKPPTMRIGCLLDVSDSMREVIETGRSDEQATDRLHAVLCAALKVAKTEHAHDPDTQMFIGAFGLNSDTAYPATVDLCSVIEALINEPGDIQNGHDSLIALANSNNLNHITQYIRTKLSEHEARIVHRYLQQHPERITDFVSAIPEQGVMESHRVKVTSSSAVVGTFGGLLPFGLAGAIVGFGIGALGGRKTADVAEDSAVDNSEAMGIARSICADWSQSFSTLNPRPVHQVVSLLQRLHESRTTGTNEDGEADQESRLFDKLRQHMYGKTPMRDALDKTLAVFQDNNSSDMQQMLLLISDGKSTDGDPRGIAQTLHRRNVTIASIHLNNGQSILPSCLYDQPVRGWDAGRRTLYDISSSISCMRHPVPVLASMGWKMPSSGECKLYTTLSSATAIEDFCTLLLSAHFGSADTILDLVGRFNLDAYINFEHTHRQNNPLDQEQSQTCYAHAIAAVIHMSLIRIVGREDIRCIDCIRDEIVEKCPPKPNGRDVEEVLTKALTWPICHPLRFRKVNEDEARQAVLHRRPVLTTFLLSQEEWASFCGFFDCAETRRSVLTRAKMMENGYSAISDGHAVVLTACDRNSLTFLNSWGRDWGDGGSFKIQNQNVLKSRDDSSGPSEMCFYDVFWYEGDLTDEQKQAYRAKVREDIRTSAEKYPSIFELVTSCPNCHKTSTIARLQGSVYGAICPNCSVEFTPHPGLFTETP